MHRLFARRSQLRQGKFNIDLQFLNSKRVHLRKDFANLHLIVESAKTLNLQKLVTTQVGLSYSPMHNFPRCNQRE